MADYKESRLGKITDEDVEGEMDVMEYRKMKFGSKLKQQQAILLKYNQPMTKQTLPKNPLETAIKVGNAEVAKILIAKYKLTPLALSSNFKTTLLELASQQEKRPEIFESVIDAFEVAKDMQLYKPVQTLISMYAEMKQGGKSFPELSEIFAKLETKLFEGA